MRGHEPAPRDLSEPGQPAAGRASPRRPPPRADRRLGASRAGPPLGAYVRSSSGDTGEHDSRPTLRFANRGICGNRVREAPVVRYGSARSAHVRGGPMSETFQHPVQRHDRPAPQARQPQARPPQLKPTRRMANAAILSAGAFTAASLGASLTAFSAQATLEDILAGAPAPAVLPYDVFSIALLRRGARGSGRDRDLARSGPGTNAELIRPQFPAPAQPGLDLAGVVRARSSPSGSPVRSSGTSTAGAARPGRSRRARPLVELWLGRPDGEPAGRPHRPADDFEYLAGWGRSTPSRRC